jgi:DNA end-binding protein Ku
VDGQNEVVPHVSPARGHFATDVHSREERMRTTWNGSLTFGLVSIPVGLAPATKPAARQSDVSFRLLHRECLTPIKQKRWCPLHDRELAPDEIVKGWEASKGHFVVVEEAELEALETHDDSRSIEISRFVPVDEVDPIWRDRTYFLVPGTTPAQRRPYRLLLEAMRETRMGAIGRFVRSGRESLCLVRGRGDALVLETLYLAEDVYSDAEIAEAVEATDVKKPELELANQIIDSLEGAFEPAALTSSFRHNLRALLEAKLQGAELPPPAEPEEPKAPAGDLLAALRASVAAAKDAGTPAPAKAARKPAAAKAKKPASRSKA